MQLKLNLLFSFHYYRSYLYCSKCITSEYYMNKSSQNDGIFISEACFDLFLRTEIDAMEWHTEHMSIHFDSRETTRTFSCMQRRHSNNQRYWPIGTLWNAFNPAARWRQSWPRTGQDVPEPYRTPRTNRLNDNMLITCWPYGYIPAHLLLQLLNSTLLQHSLPPSTSTIECGTVCNVLFLNLVLI